MDNNDQTIFTPAVLIQEAASTPTPSRKAGKSGLLGTAEWTGTTVRFRLSPAADPRRKWLDLRDHIRSLGEPMSTIPELAVEQGRRLAHKLSLRALEMKASPIVKARHGQTVDEWFDLWCADRVRRGEVSSDKDDRCAYRVHIACFIGKLAIAEVGKGEIQAIVARLDERIIVGNGGEVDEPGLDGISWKRASNVWTTLSAMFRDAAHSKPARGLVVRADDPTADVQPPERGLKRKRAFLYPNEYLQLVTAPAIWESSGRDILVARHYRRWARLFTLAIYLMMRAGELRALRWEHIDLEHRVITVKFAAVPKTAGRKEKAPKNGTVRRYEIPAAVLPLLTLMREEAGGEKARGHIMKMPPEGELADKLRRYCRLAGLTREDLFTNSTTQARIDFHDLRATGITWRARDPRANPYDIMIAAGHRDLKVTQGYIREVQALPAAFGELFPSVPAIVLGPVPAQGTGGTGGTRGTSNGEKEAPAGASGFPVALEATTGYGGGAAEHPNQAGPNSDQQIAKCANRPTVRIHPSGPHNEAPGETTAISGHLGPSGPVNTTDRAGSNTVDGPATNPVEAALRGALEAAIAAGNVAAAGKLAAALAEERARPTATVLPMVRRAG